MEDEEPLQASTALCQQTGPIQNKIDDLLPNRVMSPGVIVGSVLFASDHLLGVEQMSIDAGPDLVYDGWLEIDEDRSRDILLVARVAEERAEGIVSGVWSGVFGHSSVRLDAMLQAVQLPAGIPNLDTGLPNVYTDTFTHGLTCVTWNWYVKLYS